MHVNPKPKPTPLCGGTHSVVPLLWQYLCHPTGRQALLGVKGDIPLTDITLLDIRLLDIRLLDIQLLDIMLLDVTRPFPGQVLLPAAGVFQTPSVVPAPVLCYLLTQFWGEEYRAAEDAVSLNRNADYSKGFWNCAERLCFLRIPQIPWHARRHAALGHHRQPRPQQTFNGSTLRHFFVHSSVYC